MDFNIQKILEEINAIQEDELIDEFDIDSSVQPEIVTASPTEILDAKTKVSRALDLLKNQIKDFETSVLSELESLDQINLINLIKEFDLVAEKITKELAGETTSDIVDAEEGSEEVEENILPDEESDEKPDEEPDEDIEFEEQASLDLFSEE